jgi:putative membrane protein insertion efficiency factor
MRRALSFLARLPRLLLIGVVRLYQLVLSPHLGHTCRFHPTCSSYAIQAFREYGALKGLVLTVYRLARCHPWGGHGYDPPRWFGNDAEPHLSSSSGSPSSSPEEIP